MSFGGSNVRNVENCAITTKNPNFLIFLNFDQVATTNSPITSVLVRIQRSGKQRNELQTKQTSIANLNFHIERSANEAPHGQLRIFSGQNRELRCFDTVWRDAIRNGTVDLLPVVSKTYTQRTFRRGEWERRAYRQPAIDSSRQPTEMQCHNVR